MELLSQVTQVAHLSLQAFFSLSARLCTLFSSLEQLWAEEHNLGRKLCHRQWQWQHNKGFLHPEYAQRVFKICLLLLQAHLLSAQQYSWKCCVWNQRKLFSAKKNNPEVVAQHFVQHLHIQNIREKCQPCCCTQNLLACPGPNCVDPICFWRRNNNRNSRSNN